MRDHLRTIVAGIATPEDDSVLATSIHLAQRMGATLHLVHAYPADEESAEWNPETWLAGMLPRSPRARLLECRLQAQVTLRSATVPVECVALPGRAGEVLPTYAAEVRADVLVLAPTRRGGPTGAVLGTTASRVLRGRSVPVLVLREPLAEHPARRVLLPTDLSEHSARALPLGVELAAALASPETPLLLPLLSGSRAGVIS